MTMVVIGCGGAGGNMANKATEFGLLSAAINFSQKDLDSLDKVKHKLKLSGSEGVGHDRNLAISLVQEQYEVPLAFIKENFSNPLITVFAFAFASSGGSGSGMAPILMDLVRATMPDKIVIAIPVVPDQNESTINQVNCAATFEELHKLDVAIFPVDNQQVRNNNEPIGKGQLYEIANTYIIEKLAKIVAYTEKHSKNGNFDRKDLSTLLGQRGIAVVSEVDIVALPKADLNPESIAASIQESWLTSIFVPIDYDHVMRSAIIFDGQEDLMPFIDHQLIFDCFNNKMPIDLFEGNYHEKNGQILTILTGLPWCKERLYDVERLIEEGSKKMENALNIQEKVEYKSKSSDFSMKFKQNTRENSGSVSNILDKYRR